MGQSAAVGQCLQSPEECAAHAFSLWKTHRLVLQPSPERLLFERVGQALEDLYHWGRDVVCSMLPRQAAEPGNGESVLSCLERVRAQRDGEGLAQALFGSVASGERARGLDQAQKNSEIEQRLQQIRAQHAERLQAACASLRWREPPARPRPAPGAAEAGVPRQGGEAHTDETADEGKTTDFAHSAPVMRG